MNQQTNEFDILFPTCVLHAAVERGSAPPAALAGPAARQHRTKQGLSFCFETGSRTHAGCRAPAERMEMRHGWTDGCSLPSDAFHWRLEDTHMRIYGNVERHTHA